MYLNSTTSDVYGPKTSGAWGGIVANIRGTPGVAGATGPAGYSPLYIVAAGVPAPATGNNGDMYLNSTTSDLYGPKTAGAWGGIVANIKGGTGAQGPPGVAYTPRGAYSSATTYAQGDEATDGSVLYISLQSSNTNHTPASSPTWWQPVATGGIAGHQILDEGAALTQRAALNFVGAGVTATDDSANNRTIVTITSGGGTPGGSDKQVQFNNAGAFAGSANLVWDNATGRLGIGTASPLVALDMPGFNTASTVMRVGSLETLAYQVGNIQLAENLSFNGSSWVYRNNGFAEIINFGEGALGSIRILTAPSGTAGATVSPAQVMRIANDGKVMIGTGNAVAKLHVIGVSNTPNASADAEVFCFQSDSLVQLIGGGINGGNYAFWLQTKYVSSNGSTWPLCLNPVGGNVGIGTTTPLNKFQVNAGVDFNMAMRYDGSSNCMTLATFNDAGSAPTAMNFNASSVRVNGNPIPLISAQSANLIGAGRVAGTAYQNTSGKPMFVNFTGSGGSGANVTALVGSSSSLVAANTVAVQTVGSTAGLGEWMPVSFWVLPNYWYQVTLTGGATAQYWVEWT